jgi:hypothetical protein
VILVVAFGRRAPLDEEQRVRLRNIARCLVNLERQGLELLNGSIRSDDVEEAWVVGHEARCLDFLVANDGPSAPARLEVSSSLGISHRSNSLVGHICSRRSVEYRAIEDSRNDGQTRILVRHPRPATAVEAGREGI